MRVKQEEYKTIYCCAALAMMLLCCAPAAFCQETPQALFQKAEELYKAKNFVDALPLYQKVIAADASCAPAYRGAVLCYGNMGNAQGALKYMDSLFMDRPDSAEVHYGMGCALYGLQKYDDAAKYFDKAINLKPDLAAAWNNRGSIYHFVTRDYAKARQYYQKAIELGTRTGNDAVVKVAQENLTNLPREEDMKPMSLEDFLNAFIARADDNDTAGVRWLVMGQKANCEPAMDYFLDQALKASAQGGKGADQAGVALATLLADEYSSQHKSDALKKKLRTYSALSNEAKKKIWQGVMLSDRGAEREQQGAFAEAEQDYREAAACFSFAGDKARMGVALLNLGDAQRRLKKYSDAGRSYSEAVTAFMEAKDEKQRAQALTYLGITNSLQGQHAEAIEFLKRALKIYTDLKDTKSAQKVRENIALVEQARGKGK